MALFPAYSLISDKNKDFIDDSDLKESDSYPDEPTELQLLVSDDNSEDDKPHKYTDNSSSKVSYSADISNKDYYIDCKLDYGNLRVSTLYYPGRPQYKCSGRDRLQSDCSSARESRKRRYYCRRVCDEPAAPAVAARTAALRALIAHSPQDVILWEQYIDFQEEWCGAEAALQAADEACERVSAPRLRARRLAALRAAAPPQRVLERLRDMLAKEKCAIIRTELWEELLQVLPAAPDGDASQVTAAAGAALRDTRAAPLAAAAPARLLYAAAAALRSAGHWERLALLLHLLVAMNYAPAALAPPAPELVERVERRLRAAEDTALASGLPLSAVWVRVERLRAAAHWHGASVPDADPQRTPLPHDVAELLPPVTDDQLPALSARMLALAQVPALPGAQWAARAVGGGAGAGAGAGAAEALLPLLEAARALPPAHPAAADPALARRVLALLLDPPHYFTDDSGFLSWVNGMWDACMSRAHGAWLTALLCWRLRWLCALLALAPGDEAARLRSEARTLLRRYNTINSPLPFAEFARVEAASSGEVRARHVALAALRAALSDADCPQHYALYIARIFREVSSDVDASKCALVCAVLNRALPTELQPPSQDDLRIALDMCEERCGGIEAELESEEDEDVVVALSPGAGEWARARAVLAGAGRRAALLRAARAGARGAVAGGRRAARYYEESAEALCATVPRAACWARTFSHLFPDNAYLALASAGAPLWALGGAGGGATGAAEVRGAGGHTAALATLLPPLLRAIKTDFAPTEAEALVRVARRVTSGAGGGAGGGALWAARLEAEARAPVPRLPAALYHALDRAPGDKWLYVRGAAWCGGEAGALADALLERALRLHALPDELTPIVPTATVLEPGTDNCETHVQ